MSSGHLFALSCAKVLLYLDRVLALFSVGCHYFVVCPCLQVTFYYFCIYSRPVIHSL